MGRLADFIREQSIVLDGQKKSKMLFLDTKLEEIEAERDSLKTENLHLKAQVNPLQEKVDRLQQRVEEKSAKPVTKDDEHLNDTDTKIVKILAVCEVEDSPPPSVHDMAKFLKMNIIRTEVFLDSLRERRYIYISSRFTESRYELAPKGKKYLVDKEIL